MMNKLDKDQLDNLVTDYKNNIRIKDLSQKYSICSTTISKYMRETGTPLRVVGKGRITFEVDEDFFESIDSHAKAQILGFIFADGSVNIPKGSGSYCMRIQIQDRDREILEQIKSIMGYTGELFPRKIKDKYYIGLRICRKKTVMDLVKLGCIEQKTLQLQMPNIKEEYLPSFIYGYWLGDGWASWRTSKNGITFYYSIISSDAFITSFINILESLGIKKPTITPHPRSKGISTIRIANREGFKKICQWMMANKILDIKRKTKKIQEIIDYLSIKYPESGS